MVNWMRQDMEVTNAAAVFLVIFLVANTTPVSLAEGWNYDGSDGELDPNNWKSNFALCGGNKQSPININTSTIVSTTGSLAFNGYSTSSSQNFTLTNNGHSIQINVIVNTITVTSSILGATYALEQFHFHWGPTNYNGSEHSVDGKFHPFEIHLVHYNKDKYSSVQQAAATDDSSAILVLGIFADVASSGTSASPIFDSLVSNLAKVSYAGNVTSMAPFALQNLLPSVQSIIYMYHGSLTTPGCAEDVNWNIFKQPIYITSEQLDQFRHVHGADPSQALTYNDRPVQPLNGRTVYWYNGPVTVAGTTGGSQSVHSDVLITLLGAIVVISVFHVFSVFRSTFMPC